MCCFGPSAKGDSDGDDMFADESDEEGGKPPAKKKAFDTKPVGAAAGSIQEVGL